MWGACVNWSFDIIVERENYHSIYCGGPLTVHGNDYDWHSTILAAYMYNDGFIGWPFLAMCKPLFTSF